MITKFELYNESLRNKMKGKSENDILNYAYKLLLEYNTLSFDKDFSMHNPDNFGWKLNKMRGWLEEKFDRYTEGNGVYLLIRPSNKIPFKNVYKYKTFNYNEYSSFIKYDVPKKYFKFFLKQLIVKTLSGEYENFNIKIVGNYLNKLDESLKDKLKGKTENEISVNLDDNDKIKNNLIKASEYGLLKVLKKY